MKQLINIEEWTRRDNYGFFREYLNSWYSVTTEIDCTAAFASAKAGGTSFFMRYLYAFLVAANEIEEFRYRTDNEGNVVLYDKIDIITPVAVPGKTFVTVRIPYASDFAAFQAKAHEIISSVSENDDPYGVEKALFDTGDYDIIHLSAVPKMYFTSMSYTVHKPGKGCTHPLSVAGKAVCRDGRRLMPFSIYVDHAFVDGEHLSRLFERMEQILAG